MNKKIFTGLALILLASTVSGLELSMQDINGSVTGTEFDVLQPEGFYSDFPENFDRPEEVGSYSFTDNSLLAPNIYLSYESSEDLTGERLQIFYSSLSGELKRSVSTYSAPLNGSSGNVDLEVSSFEALYPGKIYGGLKSENGVKNFTEVSGGLFPGNFTVEPTVFRLDNRTEIKITEIFSSGNEIHSSRYLSDKLFISIERNEKVLGESEASIGESASIEGSLRGGDKIYVNSLLSLTVDGIDPCATLSGSNRYYIIDENTFNADPEDASGGEKSCLNIENVENSVIDFSNSTLDGNGNFSNPEACGMQISNSDNVEIKNAKIQEFSRGLCLYNSENVTVNGVSVQSNGLGVYGNSSSASIKDMTLVNENSELRSVSDTEIEMGDISLSSAEISVSGLDLDINDVFNAPPDPSGTENISQWVDISPESGSSVIDSLSFHYSGENPDSIYLAENNDGWSYSNLSASSTESEIFIENSVDSFSIFAPYVKKEDDEEDSTEEPPEDGEGGSGGGGGGGAGGGGGFPPGPPPGAGPGEEGPPDGVGGGPPPWVPAGLSPKGLPRLDLESESERFEVQQGRTFRANFSVAVTGNVSANDVSVNSTVRKGWATSRDNFDEILPGENVSGGVLMDVYDSEIIGEYNFTLKASTVINDTFVVLANETYIVEVMPRGEVRDLEVLEAPYRVNLTENSVEELEFDLKNTGDYRLENIEASVMNTAPCMNVVSGSSSLDSGDSRPVVYSVSTGDAKNRCEGAFVFSSDKSDLLAVAPVKVNILEMPLTEKLTSNILPVLVLAWTVFTLYWVRRRLHEQ